MNPVTIVISVLILAGLLFIGIGWKSSQKRSNRQRTDVTLLADRLFVVSTFYDVFENGKYSLFSVNLCSDKLETLGVPDKNGMVRILSFERWLDAADREAKDPLSFTELVPFSSLVLASSPLDRMVKFDYKGVNFSVSNAAMAAPFDVVCLPGMGIFGTSLYIRFYTTLGGGWRNGAARVVSKRDVMGTIWTAMRIA